MRQRAVVFGTAIVIAATACGGGARQGGAPPRDSHTITLAELTERHFTSLGQAIQALRPNWLSMRGPDGDVQVYVDQVHLGGLEALRMVRVTSVEIIRHMDGIQATARYGLGHENGVILISTRAGSPP